MKTPLESMQKMGQAFKQIIACILVVLFVSACDSADSEVEPSPEYTSMQQFASHLSSHIGEFGETPGLNLLLLLTRHMPPASQGIYIWNPDTEEFDYMGQSSKLIVRFQLSDSGPGMAEVIFSNLEAHAGYFKKGNLLGKINDVHVLSAEFDNLEFSDIPLPLNGQIKIQANNYKLDVQFSDLSTGNRKVGLKVSLNLKNSNVVVVQTTIDFPYGIDEYPKLYVHLLSGNVEISGEMDFFLIGSVGQGIETYNSHVDMKVLFNGEEMGKVEFQMFSTFDDGGQLDGMHVKPFIRLLTGDLIALPWL
jgi:hypothetical protein